MYEKYATRLHLLAPGTSNPKMAKGQHLGLSFALSLASAHSSGVGNVCPHASPGCSESCLFYAGRGQMPTVQRARIEKTRLFFQDRDGFLTLLDNDLRAVNRLGSVAVRLNVFSDIPWHVLLSLDTYPNIQFYDYTKAFGRLTTVPHRAPNYHLTFSLSELNKGQAREALQGGFNVATVFAGPKPVEYLNYPVIDGDTHDYRFLDDGPAVVGLKAKGRARHDASGFVVQ